MGKQNFQVKNIFYHNRVVKASI